MKAVCVGDNVVDRYLEEGWVFPGGNALNTAVHMKRCGVDAAYIGILGSDLYGQHVQRSLQQEGVDCRYCRVKDGSNWVTDVVLRGGDRVFQGSDRGVYSPFSLRDQDGQYAASFPLVHTSIYSETTSMLQHWKEMDLIVSFDYADCWDEDLLQQSCPHVDIGFFSGESFFTEDESIAFLTRVRAIGCNYAIMTRGSLGSLALTDQGVHEQEAFPVDVIDTMGAGDAYIGCFLSWWLQGSPLSGAMRKASRYAAENCLHHGAIGYKLDIPPQDCTCG